ncbi:MAG: nucleotide sugar dehydrogenase [Methanomassiliicoccales archaeon]|nr:nucleotide sugar dehydrogenase [Methanomassiliicoccales archaeon]
MMNEDTVSVVGLGYVGLPLACKLAESGVKVIGIDKDEIRVSHIHAGRNPLKGEEPGLDELLERVVSLGLLTASNNTSAISGTDAVFVCVNTPMEEKRKPNLEPLENAIRDIGRNMANGTLISIESTIPPGTMDGMVLPILEEESGLKAGKDFLLVHCPERVMPGRLLLNMSTYQRTLGGLDEESIKKARAYYSRLVDAEIHETDMLSAEITKTVENAYRDVQIAFANEIALACEELGADAFEIRKLVNTSPFRDMHYPGSGVGGHCIPKDPWLLVSSVSKDTTDLIPVARKINDMMPIHLAQLARIAMAEAGVDIEGARVTILGLGFLKDSGDTRNSPAKPIIDEFIEDSDVVVHDPYANEEYRAPLTKKLDEALDGSDCAIFVTDHTIYETLTLDFISSRMRTKVIVDGRDLFDAEMCENAGFYYSGIGKGRKSKRISKR